jgi:hypothetical protein
LAEKGLGMIKKLVLIVAMGTVGLLWGAGDVTIQVINAVKEKSITPEFDKKLAKSGLSIHKVVEGGRYIVTLGTFKDEKSAQSALKKVRGIVCKEAFVRFVKRDQVAMGSHDTAKNIKSDKEVNAVVAHEASGHAVKEVAAVTVPKTEHVVAVDVKPVVIEVKNTPVAVTPVCPSVDKKEVHQNEISEAISYYKNSPYHRFEPVMLLP